MGTTVFIGYLENKSLHITLNRKASDALELILNESLEKKHPKIYEKIMEVLVLDQVSFTELTKDEFNIAIKAIKSHIINIGKLTEWKLYQKETWKDEIEPLVLQDKRYLST